MIGGGQEQEPKASCGLDRRLLGRNQELQNGRNKNLENSSSQDKDVAQTRYAEGEQDEDEDEEDDDDELLSEALLAVASAEEYAAKILKLQQACLTPLKEDLADWLNKIMNVSNITTDNFMDKLDNGVIICRLAKIISLWCQQQLATSGQGSIIQQQSHNKTISQLKIDSATPKTTTSITKHPLFSQSYSSKLSSSTLSVHSPIITNNDSNADTDNHEPFHNHHSKNNTIVSVLATPLKQLQPRLIFANGPSRSSSQSTNCLTTSSTTCLNIGYLSGDQFLNNLIIMDQTKIWEEAKCRTFYARDNVCNFIRWSKEFGVNQSVLFESDDLVLHANPRQVVLCLLDVARIACVKHGFTEAPGLVKFEQEIDRELAAENEAAIDQYAECSADGYPNGDKLTRTNETSLSRRKLSSLVRNSRESSIADATDDLIMRYCKHKEEEAARKKVAELKATKLKENESKTAAAISNSQVEFKSERKLVDNAIDQSKISINNNKTILCETDSLVVGEDKESVCVMKSPSGGDLITPRNNLTYDSRIDSLDSGEGRTESASTSHSRTPINLTRNHSVSAIPVPIKRSNSSSSLTSNQTSSVGTSELSSSRSSLLSGQESNFNTKRHIASDLDGKVMRIAKSYYGKGATKGVTRLSEGKYKIADRIVFVRLLKGHRVMVRIGGGWDTLENFLFRHKSDPSQVIDVDNLLPLETKMTFERSPQLTPTNNKFSKLPFYQRSSSASSTNLSISNLSVSNHSPTSSAATSTSTNIAAMNTPNNGIELSHRQSSVNKRIPYLFIHRGQNTKLTSPSAFYNQSDSLQHPHPKESINKQKMASNINRYNNRPLGSARTPTASSTNLYPATLTARLASTNIKTMGSAKLNSTINLHNGRTSKQEAFLKLGRSNDSLQASFYKSPQHRQHQQNGSSYNGNLSAKRKIDNHRRSTNGLVRQTANSVNS